MGFMCACQLSNNLSEYVYCHVNTSILDVEPNTILIFPKMDFHWDGGLHFLKSKFPESIKEVSEGFFEYESDINIDKVMKILGINYSQDLYDSWNSDLDAKCSCDSCNNKHLFPKLEFKSGNKTDSTSKCSFGYVH